MPGFASRFLTDEISFLDDGLSIGTLSAAGTHSGSPMKWGGIPPTKYRIAAFVLQSGAGGSVTFYLQTATGSAGAFATFTSPNQTASAAQMTPTAPKNYLVAMARGEALEDLATMGYWVQPVVVLAGSVTPSALTTMGYMGGNDPPESDATLGITIFAIM